MTGINPIGNNNEIKVNHAGAEASHSDIVIFNFDDQNPVGNKQQPYEVKFDKDGYPIPDGDKLVLIPEKTFPLLFWYKRKAEYVYKADGKEHIYDIKNNCHLKDNAINRCQKYIKSDNYQPTEGITICFMKEDVDTQWKE